MKKVILLLSILGYSSGLLMAGLPLSHLIDLTTNGENGPHPLVQDSSLACDELLLHDISPNLIHYSYEAGNAMYLQTVDEKERPIACMLRINQGLKFYEVSEKGIIAFDKDLKINHISVFHNAKMYDFVPADTDHNKLTLVLDTQSQRFDLFEDRLHKINYEQPTVRPDKKIIKLVDYRHSYPNEMEMMAATPDGMKY